MTSLLMIGLLIFIFIMPFVAIGSIIAIVIMAIMKKNLKIPAITLGSSVIIFIILFISINTLDGYMSHQPEAANNNPSAGVEVSVNEHETENDELQEPENEEEIETDLSPENKEKNDGDFHLTKDGRDPTDLSQYNSDINIRDIERKPEDFKNEWIEFEGRIIQVMEGDATTAYRIAVNDDIDNVVYLEVLTTTLDQRLLKDDNVKIYATFNDLITYETVMGSSQTIPAFNAHGDRIILDEEN